MKGIVLWNQHPVQGSSPQRTFSISAAQYLKEFPK
jgi:hypothetical protein